MGLRQAAIWAASLMAVSGLSIAAGSAKTHKEGPLTTDRPALRYGLRHDPMEFVEHDQTLQGALLRTRVFGRPQEGDRQIINEKIGRPVEGRAQAAAAG